MKARKVIPEDPAFSTFDARLREYQQTLGLTLAQVEANERQGSRYSVEGALTQTLLGTVSQGLSIAGPAVMRRVLQPALDWVSEIERGG